jgi:dTDP-4-dehydrorhamnose 3,5-epimerase
MSRSWLPTGSVRDRQSVTPAWQPKDRPLIAGVVVKEVANVPCEQRMITEVFRRDWFENAGEVDQIFQSILYPGALEAWHAHETTTDRLFVTSGMLMVVLYDGRSDSPTFGLVNEFNIGLFRPQLLIVPPQVWHGVHNRSGEPATILNAPDLAYRYEEPDHWRLPWNTDQIPYRFDV